MSAWARFRQAWEDKAEPHALGVWQASVLGLGVFLAVLYSLAH